MCGAVKVLGKVGEVPPLLVVMPLTMVPDFCPRPSWWPNLQHWARGRLLLGGKGQRGILWVPTKKGYVRDEFGLKWDLAAYMLEL